MGILLNRSRTALLPEHSLAEYNSSADIERVVAWAQAELDLLSLKRAAIAMRVRVIKNTIVGLADVFGSTLTDEELRTLPPTLPVRRTARPCRGLTQACRLTLRGSSTPLTTQELCRRIEETHPEILARQKEPRVSVTVVLRRLVNYGEVYDNVDEANTRTWLWIRPLMQDKVIDDHPFSL
jgi:hypothetical protein